MNNKIGILFIINPISGTVKKSGVEQLIKENLDLAKEALKNSREDQEVSYRAFYNSFKMASKIYHLIMFNDLTIF